jgi:hypothetical protein
VRTLVIGLSLPNAQFDNYSFISAPSFGEYAQVIVDMASVSRTIDDVVHGTVAHSTYGGQAVVNGEASAHAFPLRELLQMRCRETEWLLAHGGLVVLLGYPDLPHADLAGGAWHSYAWLPEPEGFSFERDLLAGFGRAGAVLVDAEHPFAPYVQALASRLAYRVYVNEESPALAENGSVFARSEGGVPIAFEVRDGDGHLVVLPPILRPESDRAVITDAFLQSFERWGARNSPPATDHSHAIAATEEVP